MPIERRNALRSVARDVTSRPSNTTLPPLGSSSRLMQRSSVLLPEPDGPMMKTSSRSLTERSMPFKTSVAPKLFLRPAMLRIAIP